MHIFMFLYIFMFLRLYNMYLFIYIYMYIYIYTYAYIHICICICICIYICICIFICIYINVYIYIYKNVFTYIYIICIYIYIDMYRYIFTYTYMYRQINNIVSSTGIAARFSTMFLFGKRTEKFGGVLCKTTQRNSSEISQKFHFSRYSVCSLGVTRFQPFSPDFIFPLGEHVQSTCQGNLQHPELWCQQSLQISSPGSPCCDHSSLLGVIC